MKVGIIIVVYNLDVQIFLLQMESIQKFCKDDYEIQIVDNSSIPQMAESIKYHCGLLKINYTKTHATSTNGTDSHIFAANTAYHIFRNAYSYIMLLDHDCICVKPFSIVEILKDKEMGGLGQGGKIPYFWLGCVCFNNDNVDKELIDFSYSHELGLDSGGMLYKVIEKYGKDRCVFFNESYHQNCEFNGKRNMYSMINDGMFLHMVNASNWSSDERHQERINSLLSITRRKIKENDHE